MEHKWKRMTAALLPDTMRLKPPLLALPLSVISLFQGQNTLIKETCSLLQSTSCSFPPSAMGGFPELVVLY